MGSDEVAFRLAHLTDDRARACLQHVATAGGWGDPLPAGHAHGVAIHVEYRSAVAYLVEMMRKVTDGDAILYGGRAGFLQDNDAVEHMNDVASVNWHASASLIGRFLPEALLIDAGTTTTDLVPVKGGAVAALRSP